MTDTVSVLGSLGNKREEKFRDGQVDVEVFAGHIEKEQEPLPRNRKGRD